VIARLEATVAFVADALRAFGDTDYQDVRRVKAVALLANPVRAVELLAAFAALRSRTSDRDLLDELPDEPPDEEPASGPAAGDAMCRMDAFARRVGFKPTHLPAWMTARAADGGEEAPTFTFDWSRLLPSLTLYLHLSHDDVVNGRGGVVRWEGEGPVTHEFVHEHLRPMHGYVIQPVIDPLNLAPVDAYEIPDRHRQAVHLRTPADTFPFSSNLSRAVDLDHTEEYDAASASSAEKHWSTRMGNLAPLGRFGHRIKTHGRWTVRQPFDGIQIWRDPHGQVYLVDHTGTHRITRSGRPAGQVRRFDPDVDVVSTDVIVLADFRPTA
jgi:hypothetical protein